MDRREYYVDKDDENLLLDDENIGQKCVMSSKKIWTNGDIEVNKNWNQNVNNFFFNDESRSMTEKSNEEQDNSEDSPLLINDCYRQNDQKEFHCHDSVHYRKDENAWKKLLFATITCLSFMIVEFLGGYFSGSLAVMTDAVHLLSDFIAFLISLLSIWIGKKPPSKNMTFGYHRVEVFGALLSVLTIWILVAVFCVLAISRLYHRNYEINADTMIGIASLGVIVNIVMGLALYGGCHNHSHGLDNSSHGNINVRAAVAHVIGDLVQSLGVLIAALIIKFNPSAIEADPICTLIFSVIAICTTLKVGKDSVWLLIEGSPIDSLKLTKELGSLDNVKHIHNIHIWSLAPGKDAVTVHLAVDQCCDRDILLKNATTIIQSHINVVSCTVQIEAFNHELINSCQHCQTLQC